MSSDNLYDLFFENIKKLFYPEEWLEFDINFSKSELLTMLLVDRHGEIIMSQIAEYINLPMSTTSGMVERLVKGGYVKRERSELDRRIVVIRLTDEGNALVSKLKDKIIYYIDKINESLTEEETQLLSKIFNKVIHLFKENHREKSTLDSEKEEKKIKKILIE
ncbi:transcriptional regulator, TrmB [Alkaliphilus metalliredigens QYMF]|uniref:Transcriptional regulator, TrmB n=1 Tax=Alkaliphilus metalliredigens (strain QYMF) TaxID=293826 RepID=A6TNA7_ALKMQ|nr:MarR family transcriptional regulator [Alkaliphilus metalliredigens]ABR47675.1 transcriptional regulator, TrmB [Alkaliphilus metalliredigens QYMF]